MFRFYGAPQIAFSRDGSGNYSLPQAAFTAGTTIESTKVNSNFSDIASALTASLAKDGQTTPTANLPMGSFKHTGVANATARTHYAAAGQIADNSMGYAADTGSADAYAIAPAPGITAYAVGQRFTFKVTNANLTTTPTLAVNGLTAGTIKWPDGSALAAGDLPANALVEVVVAATTPVYHLQSVAVPVMRKSGGTFTGATTFSATVTMSGAALNAAQGADIASATTTDIGAATGNHVKITGTTTITGLGTVQAGTMRTVEFAAALTLTHNATSLILPGGASITTAAGDTAGFVSLGSGNWRCLWYQKATGSYVIGSQITASLGADVALNNTGTYFTGPSVAQGTSGTWFVHGSVVVVATDATQNIHCRLTDGTSVLASSSVQVPAANQVNTMSVSGYIASPVGNLRITVNSPSTTNASILYNKSGNSKDSTITAIRVA